VSSRGSEMGDAKMGTEPKPIDVARSFEAVGEHARIDADEELREFSRHENGASWTDLLAKPVAVILGAAGSGKTTELELAKSRLRAEGREAFLLDVAPLADSGLQKAIRTDEFSRFLAWRDQGVSSAVLLLDSIDEAKLEKKKTEYAIRSLAGEMGAAAKRVNLVLTCRISDWNWDIDVGAIREWVRILGDVQEGKAIGVFRLEALDEKQVRQLAVHFGSTDPERFLDAIYDSNLEALATRPADVRRLVRYWIKMGQFGRLAEMMEEDVTARLNDKRASELLSFEQALAGARTISAHVTLSRRPLIALPGSELSIDTEEQVTQPREVLPSWSDSSITALLSLSLFEYATHGCVRLHHRDACDYLAGAWFEEINTTPRTVKRLVVWETGAGPRVASNFRGVLPWICLRNEEMRDWATKIAPELLIVGGDAESLPVGTRVKCLREFVRRHKDLRPLESVELRHIQRLATPEMSSDLMEWIEDRTINESVVVMLLRMVNFLRVEQATRVELKIALDKGRSPRIRRTALAGVRKRGQPRDHERASARLKCERLDPDLAGALIDLFFPRYVSVSDSIRILTRLTEQPLENRSSRLTTALEYSLPARCSNTRRFELVRALLKILDPAKSRPGKEWRVATEFKIYLRAVNRLVQAILESGDLSAQQVERVADAIERVGSSNLWRSSFTYEAPLRDSVDSNKIVKEALFWRRAKRARNAVGCDGTLRFHVLDSAELSDVGESDVEWLLLAAGSKDLVQDRLLAFDCLLDLSRRVSSSDLDRRLVALTDKEEALRKRLARRQRNRLEHPEETKWRRRRRASEIREEKQGQRDLAFLRENIDLVRSGDDESLLHALLMDTAGMASSYTCEIPERVDKSFGPEILEATREGLKAAWRRLDLPVPMDGAVDPSVHAVVVALSGIAVNLEDGLDLRSLSFEDARRAACSGLWELNRFPPWFGELAHWHSRAVGEVLGLAVLPELRSVSGDGRRLLSRLARAETEIKQLVAAEITKHLTKEPVGTSNALLECLRMSKANVGGWRRLKPLVARRARAALPDVARFELWWIAWLSLSPSPAIRSLRRHVRTLRGAEADDFATRVIACIEEHAELLTSSDLWESPRDLGDLIRLVYLHVRPADDVWHEGVYSPGSRDRAESVRRYLGERLVAIPTTEAYEVLRGLRDSSECADHRDWFASRAEAQAIGAASENSMNTKDVLAFAQRRSAVPQSADQLFTRVLDTCEDIGFAWREGDLNYREVFSQARTKGRVSECAVQKWLASELRWRSDGCYQTEREVEVVGRNRPDIQVSNASCQAIVRLELKVADYWSGPQLDTALDEQLVGKYLRDPGVKHGALVVCAVGAQKHWVPRGRSLTFEELVAFLRDRAAEIADRRSVMLSVIPFDFRE
jgi:hypothetical protein